MGFGFAATVRVVGWVRLIEAEETPRQS